MAPNPVQYSNSVQNIYKCIFGFWGILYLVHTSILVCLQETKKDAKKDGEDEPKPKTFMEKHVLKACTLGNGHSNRQ